MAEVASSGGEYEDMQALRLQGSMSTPVIRGRPAISCSFQADAHFGRQVPDS